MRISRFVSWTLSWIIAETISDLVAARSFDLARDLHQHRLRALARNGEKVRLATRGGVGHRPEPPLALQWIVSTHFDLSAALVGAGPSPGASRPPGAGHRGGR